MKNFLWLFLGLFCFAWVGCVRVGNESHFNLALCNSIPSSHLLFVKELKDISVSDPSNSSAGVSIEENKIILNSYVYDFREHLSTPAMSTNNSIIWREDRISFEIHIEPNDALDNVYIKSNLYYDYQGTTRRSKRGVPLENEPASLGEKWYLIEVDFQEYDFWPKLRHFEAKALMSMGEYSVTNSQKIECQGVCKTSKNCFYHDEGCADGPIPYECSYECDNGFSGTRTGTTYSGSTGSISEDEILQAQGISCSPNIHWSGITDIDTLKSSVQNRQYTLPSPP